MENVPAKTQGTPRSNPIVYGPTRILSGLLDRLELGPLPVVGMVASAGILAWKLWPAIREIASLTISGTRPIKIRPEGIVFAAGFLPLR